MSFKYRTFYLRLRDAKNTNLSIGLCPLQVSEFTTKIAQHSDDFNKIKQESIDTKFTLWRKGMFA